MKLLLSDPMADPIPLGLEVSESIGLSKPGGCLYTDRVLRTRSQTQ